jgi:hypothetical protein
MVNSKLRGEFAPCAKPGPVVATLPKGIIRNLLFTIYYSELPLLTAES